MFNISRLGLSIQVLKPLFSEKFNTVLNRYGKKVIAQIIFEIIVIQIIKQIDYLRLSIELDIKESGIFKSVLSFVLKEKKLEEKVIIAQGGSLYTAAEEKMIAEIKDAAQAYEEKDKLRKEQIKNIFKDWKSSKKNR